jgi:hypothetical protein
MSKLRIAIREEDAKVNAYIALSDNKDEWFFLGSIAKAATENDEIFEEFKVLMTKALVASLKSLGFPAPDRIVEETPPPHEVNKH